MYSVYKNNLIYNGTVAHDQMDHPRKVGRSLRAIGRLVHDQKDHPVGRNLRAIATVLYAGTPFVEEILQSKGVGVMGYLYATDKVPTSRRGECMISGHPLMAGVEIPQSMADLRKFISNFKKTYCSYNEYPKIYLVLFRLTKSLKDNHKGLKDNHVFYSTHAS